MQARILEGAFSTHGRFMIRRFRFVLPSSCLLAATLLWPQPCPSQAQGGNQTSKPDGVLGKQGRPVTESTLTVNLRDQTGGVIAQSAVVTLTPAVGGPPKQVTTKTGEADFEDLAPGRHTIRVVADGYEHLKQVIEVTGTHTIANLQIQRVTEDLTLGGVQLGGGMDTNIHAAAGVKMEKTRLVSKVTTALRANKPEQARTYLERLYREESQDPNVSYLYGMYEKEVNDMTKAQYYWQRALGLDPRHFASLMELGHTALDDDKTAEAVPYLRRAAQADPTAWQPQVLLVRAYSKLGQYADAAKAADRALELGHSQTEGLEVYLATTLAQAGSRERAIQAVQDYLTNQPDDAPARQLLAILQRPPADEAAANVEIPSLLPSVWMPAAVDASTPPVEPGVPCSLDTVLQKASKRITELVRDVDRFEATESLESARINGEGIAGKPETRNFRYMVTIGEPRPGLLSVDEFHGAGIGFADFPDGVQTSGLPALVLVFHPLQIDNYKFTCEGLARTDAGISWQVYFQQRPDRIPTLHGYTLGDQSYAVGLKGRAWISADTYQVVRLQTDLVKPHPEIRLVAEHTLINYGPVRFKTKNVNMWLPQTAEVYFDWRGKRVHRRLTYSNYMLFSVDDKQLIKPPKNAEAIAPDARDAQRTAKPD